MKGKTPTVEMKGVYSHSGNRPYRGNDGLGPPIVEIKENNKNKGPYKKHEPYLTLCR